MISYTIRLIIKSTIAKIAVFNNLKWLFIFMYFCVAFNGMECFVIDFPVLFWEDQLVKNIWRKKIKRPIG